MVAAAAGLAKEEEGLGAVEWRKDMGKVLEASWMALVLDTEWDLIHLNWEVHKVRFCFTFWFNI